MGLGNVWRFPTAVATSGGGAFVLLYLLAIVLLGLPLMMAELALGRRTQRDVVGAFLRLSPRTPWWLTGVLSLVAVVVILSYYSVIAGWVGIYLVASVLGRFAGLGPEQLAGVFAAISGHPVLPLAGQASFLAVTGAVVALGVRDGIERWSRVLMPGIVLILLILLGRILILPGAPAGFAWFLRPRLEVITPAVALQAVGQVFFSFSLGMGATITYGSYLRSRHSIPSSAVYISLADLLVALLAGLVVIPALFAFNIEPEVGPGLIFVALTAVFNAMPVGALWGGLFFLMLYAAALTSAVAMLETFIAYLLAGRRLGRNRAAVLGVVIVLILGIPSALAPGVLAAIRPLGRNVLEFVDFAASNVLLPLAGLFTAVFVGWIWGTGRARAELERGAAKFPGGKAWALAVGYLAPLLLLYVFLAGLRP